MSSSSLTTHLLSLTPTSLISATTHPFLTAAAKATLPREKVIAWLAQDRLYALSYINFIGDLLSNLHLQTSSSVIIEGVEGKKNLEWQVADTLVDCLVNIRREIRLFETVAREEGFLEEILGAREGRATRCYRDLFAGAIAGGKGMVVGMVVLWASEVCYLRAWRFAAQSLRLVGNVEGEGDVMQRVFIPNWSDEAFEAFVGRLGGVVDVLGEKVEEGGETWRECEEGWRQVVFCEEQFWPEV